MYYYSSEPSGQGVYWISLLGSVFVSGGSLETASLETLKVLMFAPCSQHVPIQYNVLCREMRRQLGPQQEHCSPPQASSSFHATFVVLLPTFVSPKTASLQPVIDPELLMDLFMDSVLAFSTALRWFRTRHNPLYVETAHFVIGIFGIYPFAIYFQR